jgi:hypothetical protein
MRRRLSPLLIFLGWSLFGIALACPALHDDGNTLPGWYCFLVSLCIWPMWVIWMVAICGITNLLFLFGLLVYYWGGGLERKTYGVFFSLATIATLIVLLTMFDGILAGAYVWLTSLVITAIGFLLAGYENNRGAPYGVPLVTG